MGLTKADIALMATRDKTILDIVRLCPKGAATTVLREVTQYPPRAFRGSLMRLREQGLIQLRPCADGEDRWFWVTPPAMRTRRTG